MKKILLVIFAVLTMSLPAFAFRTSSVVSVAEEVQDFLYKMSLEKSFMGIYGGICNAWDRFFNIEGQITEQYRLAKISWEAVKRDPYISDHIYFTFKERYELAEKYYNDRNSIAMKNCGLANALGSEQEANQEITNSQQNYEIKKILGGWGYS